MAIAHAVSKLTIASETVHVAHVLSAGAVSRPHPCDFGLEPSSVLAITAAEETTDIAEVAEGPSVMVPRADKACRVQGSNTDARAWPLLGAARRPSAPGAWAMGQRS